jgi:tetratricopeptide (TPR) repeat protein
LFLKTKKIISFHHQNIEQQFIELIQRCYTFRGEYEKAIEAYKIALQHIKTEPYVMGALFSLLTQLGQFERGIEVFCRLLLIL